MSHRLCMIIQKEIEKGINKKENVLELINNKSMSFKMKIGCFFISHMDTNSKTKIRKFSLEDFLKEQHWHCILPFSGI